MATQNSKIISLNVTSSISTERLRAQKFSGKENADLVGKCHEKMHSSKERHRSIFSLLLVLIFQSPPEASPTTVCILEGAILVILEIQSNFVFRKCTSNQVQLYLNCV